MLLHPKTIAAAGELYGRHSHPRNRQLSQDGIEMVAASHAAQLQQCGYDIAAVRTWNILECGGTGRDALAWSRLGAKNVTHIDLSQENVERLTEFARHNGIGNLQAIHGDILAIDLPTQSFDVVRSRGVVHHLGDPALGLARYVDWLKIGGLLHFNVYRAGTFYYYCIKSLRRLVTPDDLPQYIEACSTLQYSPELAGILLDDFFVPHMNTASPSIMQHDLRVLQLDLLGPQYPHRDVDHDARYPDLPEKVEHLQYWGRKRVNLGQPEAVAATMQYHQGQDDIALADQVPEAAASKAAFAALSAHVAHLTPAAKARALSKIYAAVNTHIAITPMSGAARHSQLQAAIAEAMAEQR